MAKSVSSIGTGDNALPNRLLVAIVTDTSVLNGSSYCFTNHWANAAQVVADEHRVATIPGAHTASVRLTI